MKPLYRNRILNPPELGSSGRGPTKLILIDSVRTGTRPWAARLRATIRGISIESPHYCLGLGLVRGATDGEDH